MAARDTFRRSLVAMVTGAALVGALVATPVGAHVTRRVKHSVKHLAKFFYTKAEADARYLTPAQGDGRYLTPAQGDARYLTPAQGDARYFTAEGEIRVNASPLDWVKINPAITQVPDAKPSIGGTTFGGSSSAAENVPFAISPTLPTVLAGRSLELVGVNACYATDAITTLDTVRIQITTNANGSGATSTALIDVTDRPNEQACRSYTLASPLAIAPESDVALQFDVDYSANAGFFFAGRATFILAIA